MNEQADGGDCSHVCNTCHDKSRCGYNGVVPGPGYMLWKYTGVVGDGVPQPIKEGGLLPPTSSFRSSLHGRRLLFAVFLTSIDIDKLKGGSKFNVTVDACAYKLNVM